MKRIFLTYTITNDRLALHSQGEWRLHTVRQVAQALEHLPRASDITWDFSGLEGFDSAGVLLFIDTLKRLEEGATVRIVGYTPQQEAMYQLLHQTDTTSPIEPPHEGVVTRMGEEAVALYQLWRDFFTFFGHLVMAWVQTLRHPRNFRFKEIVYHIHRSGLNALLITGLSAFLVGLVIAYQSGVQLEKFGADLFIVDTVGISITRELAPMITAIVIAGRSGSAYTAEIGAMKITEEIAAMRTMGFDPYYFLVIPRIVALMVALPLLIFFADMMGIVGGMVASKLQLGISMGQFVDRLSEVLEVKHYLLGMIKGPVFAFLIAMIGCFRGLQVAHNTESIGLHTTASVVNGIFLVIAFDALFSVLYTELGL